MAVGQFGSECVGLEGGERTVGGQAETQARHGVVAQFEVAECVAERNVLNTEVVGAFYKVRTVLLVAYVPEA